MVERIPLPARAPTEMSQVEVARYAGLRARPKRFLLIVGCLSLFGPLCIDMYLPALPRISLDLHASTSSVQVSLTTCLIGLGLGQLLIGPISDRIGRRPPLLAGLTLFVVASLACSLAPSAVVLLSLIHI